MQEARLALHLFLDVIQHGGAVCVDDHIHILDGIVDFPDPDLRLGACVGHLPGVRIWSPDLLHRDLRPEGAAAMSGLIAMADGAVGLLALLEADSLQLLAPARHS